MRCGGIYDTICELALGSGFSRRDAAALQEAYRAALESSFGMFATGCAIAIGGTVIGAGANGVKSDPLQKKYNLLYRAFAPAEYSGKEHSLHAETAAVKSVPYPIAEKTDWSKATAYVYRIAPGLPFGQGLAAPCGACAHVLADRGVRRVVYSTDAGFSEMLLEDGRADVLENGMKYGHRLAFAV